MFAFTPTPIQGKLVVTKVFKAKPPIGSDFLKQKYFLELVLGQAPPSAHALNKHNSQFCVIRITIRTKLFYIPLSFIIFSTISASEKFTRPAPRYTEASLVKKLEELGIGRPSTYAPTISTIQKRGYVVKEDREGKDRDFVTLTLEKNEIGREVKTEKFASEKSKLFPSDIGMIVTDFLNKHFDKIMDFGFTASVEEEFDKIARGQLVWNKMIEKLTSPSYI